MLEFLVANWLWILFAVVFVAMHRGGRGCGMHGHRHGTEETGQSIGVGRGDSSPLGKP